MPFQPRRSVRDYLDIGIASGALDTDTVAYILSNLAVTDLRAMFWSVTEFRVAFGFGPTTAQKVIKNLGIPVFSFCGPTGAGVARKWIPKAALVRIFWHMFDQDLEAYPVKVGPFEPKQEWARQGTAWERFAGQAKQIETLSKRVTLLEKQLRVETTQEEES